jgi:hypothetical protein
MENKNMSRPDNRPLNQRIADAHWKTVKQADNRTALERGIEEKESEMSGKRLHGDKLVLHLAKQEQRRRDEAFDERERKREHLERRRSELARLQTLKERYEADESIPMEMLVAVNQAIAQMSDPDGDSIVANEMYRACGLVEQQRQNTIAEEIDYKRSVLEAELAALRNYQFQDEEKPLTKIQLTSTTLDEQAKELFAKVCTSPEHAHSTDSIYESLKAHRAGNSSAIIAAIEHYAEVAPAPTENAPNE